MKELEIIEALSDAEQTEYDRLKRILAKNKVAAVTYLEALAAVRNKRLYRAEFSTWEQYCEKELGKSYRAINREIQAETVRQEIGARASHLSDKAAISLGGIEPTFQKEVLKEAEKAPEGPTAKSIKRAAKKLLSEPEPEQPRAFGAFTDKPVDTSAYTTAPASAPTPAASFGGDADEPEAVEDLPEVWDAASAEQRLNAIYERDKAWFNSVPQPLPRMILDRLIGGLHE